MMPLPMNPLVRQYQKQLPDYEALRAAAVAHIAQLLQQAGLKIHHITGRVKKPHSLADKLRRKLGRYTELADVTDLVGVRVITYFESDVQVVSRLVEAAYEIDWNNSIDKSKMHDPDRFGYMGVHYVVRSGPSMAAFGGLRLAGVPFEIQIRSILQHAWAEIEHDLGYKNREAVPREVSRRFYRLAGLLEMADEEFMTIARMSRDYAADLPERLRDNPDNVFIDLQSVRLLMSMPPVHPLDERVADALNVTLLVDWPDPERPQRLTTLLQYVGVHSVGQLQKELLRCEEDVVQFAEALQPRLREAWTPAGGARPGTSLVHYALLRTCENPALDTVHVLKLLDLSKQGDAAQMAGGVRSVYEQIFSALP
ncbi:GTP pyrophosphokinase family protein [Deinococcus sp.]|uniref:GTP pyrophosphokinase n=1 Tax=Deinococcus sp. TaxID=47478 RepID=UPI0025C0914A|nr:GTP pyrophosphokinase family protein [Deinococcus sp.]